ncbi:hypothetical protein GO495_13490 [Chitinophaga oryziterrae]|uniref:Cysteine-rich CPCC domain-containing protein n=1 Tax=Chitinophaga oryziterrae TaxID=1031224 RepID=A0A6N8J8N3_9BACT|nr:CPCC family cysteine-rich protein [Chitinophaga oryziterrae]MVT41600.1 hypothetical protein [Chitinophaga oryziterrae]
MSDVEILAAFLARRAHYDVYLQANDIPLYTCPGCGFPTLAERGSFDICDICSWEDDGQDDHANSILDELLVAGMKISGPNGHLSLTENRINIGRILETNAELINGEIDFDTARVLRAIAFYQQRKEEIEDRMTGDEYPHDHIWMEWKEVKKDLQMTLVVPRL